MENLVVSLNENLLVNLIVRKKKKPKRLSLIDEQGNTKGYAKNACRNETEAKSLYI